MLKTRQGWARFFCFTATVLAMCVGGLSAQTAHAQTEGGDGVLEAIPADAAAFVAVRNLQEFDRDIVTISRSLGFMLGPQGMFPAPLDWLIDVSQVPTVDPAGARPRLADALAKDGSLALVLLDSREVATSDELSNRIVYLLPASDGDALIAALGGDRGEDGTATILLMGTPFHATAKEQYVAAAREPEALRDYLASTAPGIRQIMAPDRVEAFASQDVTGWVQMGGFSEQIVQELEATITGMMFMMNPGASMSGDAGQPAEQLRQIITETEQMAFGLTVDGRGIQLSSYSAVKPGTDLAAQMAVAQPADGPLLVGLPDEPTIVAFGTSLGTDPTAKEKQIRQMLDQALSEQAVGQTLSPAMVDALKEGLVRIYQQAEIINVSASNLTAQPGTAAVALTKTVRTHDSAALLTEARKMVDVLKEAIAAVARSEQVAEQDIQAVTEAVQWREGAEEVAGIRVDHFMFDPSMLPDMDEDDLALIRGIAGPEGVLFRIAPVGMNHVAVTFGGGSERLAQVIELVQAGQSPLLAGSLRSVHNQLPAEGRIAEGYLHIDQLLTLVMTLGAQAGQPMMMPLMMRSPAPVGFSNNLITETSQETFLLLPSEMVASVREAITPLLGMMMMGGGGMGGMGPGPGMDMELPDPTGPNN